MKKLLTIAVLGGLTTLGFAQGGIHWNNTSTTLISIWGWDFSPVAMPPRTSPETTFYFGLFVAPFGTAAPDSGYPGITDPAWQFAAAYTLNSSSAAGAGRLQNPGLANVIGYNPGSTVSFLVRGWQSFSGGSDWEAAKPGIHSYGQSALGSAILGEGAIPNPSAFGTFDNGVSKQIPGFAVFVTPEPTCLALLALGGVGLCLRRRILSCHPTLLRCAAQLSQARTVPVRSGQIC